MTGLFDPETQTALGLFQDTIGMLPSGVADVPTWEVIVPQLARGAAGEEVLALQEQLNAKRGAGLSLTTDFDGPTNTAVMALQRHLGLPANGMVDLATWRNLLWHLVRPDFSRPGLCNYNGGNLTADWGTASAIAMLEQTATLFHERTGGRIAVGDISFEHGGRIDLHATHQRGLDFDLALVRIDGRRCRNPGVAYTSTRYDRSDTAELLRAIHEVFGTHLQLIYFNDPAMIGEGLSRRYPNHVNHIHVRSCEAGDAQVRYRCPPTDLPSQFPETGTFDHPKGAPDSARRVVETA